MSKSVRAVTRAFQRLYPKELADSSWDNTGLLLDASSASNTANPTVLLAIDLTASVCEEAIANEFNVIVAYHPFIFRGLKSITPDDPQQRSLLKLVQNKISVYCPHTAVDAAVGGVNDWLASGASAGEAYEVSRAVLQPVTGVRGHDGAGMGRKVELKEPVPFSELVTRVKKHLRLDTVQVVLAERHKTEPVSSFAVCAGSGSSVLRGAEADVYITGELDHHTMLFLRETGISAIVAGHSNTERGFLHTLRQQLHDELPDALVAVSTTDRDPIEYA